MARASFLSEVSFAHFTPHLGFGQCYHVDRNNQLALKQLRLSVLNKMDTCRLMQVLDYGERWRIGCVFASYLL